tara:strand:+ start:4613 stop:5275 length:663 start_codon:yes stop_codon:yes gene_type:complete
MNSPRSTEEVGKPAPAVAGPDRKPWHRHFETVGSISAIVVGVAALYVSWDQGRVMREEVRASVWPALQVDGFASREEGGLSLGLRVQNAGVGPARVERIAIEHRGEQVPDLDAMLALMPADGDLSLQTLEGRIIAAGDIVQPFSLHYADAIAEDAVDVMGRLSAQWSVEVCYCSVLDQCWVAGQDRAAPAEVDDCDGPHTHLRPTPKQPGGDREPAGGNP